MIQPVLPLILASGSPRRRELLDLMGLTYTVETPDVDESFSGRPSETVMEISRRKAAAVAARHSDSIIIAADTLVFADGALGKPHTPERAKEMLRSLAGNWHHVYTGITVINTRSGRILRNVDKTRVHLVPMTEQEIDAYVASRWTKPAHTESKAWAACLWIESTDPIPMLLGFRCRCCASCWRRSAAWMNEELFNGRFSICFAGYRGGYRHG